MSNNSDNDRQSMGVAQLSVNLLIAVMLMLAAFFSVKVLSPRFASPEAYAHQIERLDAQMETAMNLSAASAAASAVITAIPDDICTPIANQLAGISKELSFVVVVILFEKYSLTILGSVLFSYVAPACFISLAIAMLLSSGSYTKVALVTWSIKILVVVLVLWGSIPTSVFIADRIDETYHASIVAAFESAEHAGELAEASMEDADPETERVDKSWSVGAAWDAVAHAWDSVLHADDVVMSKAAELVDWAKTILRIIVEGFAVLITLSCVIPIVTIVFALWVVKVVLEPLAKH